MNDIGIVLNRGVLEAVYVSGKGDGVGRCYVLDIGAPGSLPPIIEEFEDVHYCGNVRETLCTLAGAKAGMRIIG